MLNPKLSPMTVPSMCVSVYVSLNIATVWKSHLPLVNKSVWMDQCWPVLKSSLGNQMIRKVLHKGSPFTIYNRGGIWCSLYDLSSFISATKRHIWALFDTTTGWHKSNKYFQISQRDYLICVLLLILNPSLNHQSTPGAKCLNFSNDHDRPWHRHGGKENTDTETSLPQLAGSSSQQGRWWLAEKELKTLGTFNLDSHPSLPVVHIDPATPLILLCLCFFHLLLLYYCFVLFSVTIFFYYPYFFSVYLSFSPFLFFSFHISFLSSPLLWVEGLRACIYTQQALYGEGL